MASVELRGLTKRYDSVVAVDDVSLRIEHGLLVCLLGPSGCGKTMEFEPMTCLLNAMTSARYKQR